MTLWGGRFANAPSGDLWSFTVDKADFRLLDVDVEGSLAHVEMLGEVGLLTSSEVETLVGGLRLIAADARDGTFEFLPDDEDVHSAVERRLVELVGEVGEKLHTGRSRNDQVALDLRLYMRRSADSQIAGLEALIETLAAKAEEQVDTIVPSFTHLQQAQAISLGHHLLAYAWMARRDQDRFGDLSRRLSASPLGAGASGGSSLPLDPNRAARLLGFETTFENSLEAVSSRDLVAEFIFCCAQAMVNLSRLSEDLILWATTEFGWATYADELTTGSSALPQKKNPDMAELARGRSAAVIGDLTTILALQKGLPLAYNRDLQEDKPALFHADDTLSATALALQAVLASASFTPPPPSEWTTALDLAEALVLRGVPFRQAHAAVGRLVAGLLADGRTLGDATVEDLTAADSRFQPGDLELFDPVASASRRATHGGGSPAEVRRQLSSIRRSGGAGTT